MKRRAALDAGEKIGQAVDEGVFVADGRAGHPPMAHVGVLEVCHVDPLPAGQVVSIFRPVAGSA